MLGCGHTRGHVMQSAVSPETLPGRFRKKAFIVSIHPICEDRHGKKVSMRRYPLIFHPVEPSASVGIQPLWVTGGSNVEEVIAEYEADYGGRARKFQR